MMISDRPELDLYREAKAFLVSENRVDEMVWQATRIFETFSEPDLLRETAWVILCSGFKESVIRQRFDFISLCFCDWRSAFEICASAADCRATSLTSFGNAKKIDAILRTAELVEAMGFHQIKSRILQDPIRSVQIFPFIGPITAFHVVKNLGYATAKPDRHLVRAAAAMGYSDVHNMCWSISAATGDPVQLVDVVLWRYSVLGGRSIQPVGLA